MMGLYSIRMRGAEGGPHEEGGRHISGAERIVEESDLESVAVSLIHRALHHSKGKSDFINIRIDAVHDKPEYRSLRLEDLLCPLPFRLDCLEIPERPNGFFSLTPT